MQPKQIIALVGLGAALIVTLTLSGNIFENLDASDQMVIQAVGGSMETYATPGWKPQWFGRVTHYRKRSNFEFMAPSRGGKDADHSIEVRFNDAGHGSISGSIAYELPIDREQFIRLHSLYGSQQAVENALVGPAITKAIYMTGPLMSSKESYAERRNELLSMIDDQIKHGVYRTRSFQRKVKDAISGEDKTETVVEVLRDSSGHFLREDVSPLAEFGIKTFNLAINGVIYSAEVEAQIKEQQQMTMAVQTSKMEALRAEQQRITTEQNGMAEAAKAKWAQEVAKATEVTEAEKNLAVAALDVRTAEAEKRAQILRGEGEAEARRLKMSADGALEQKLEAWVKVNQAYAGAIQGYAGAWVPSVVMGGESRTGGAASDLVQLLIARTAKDLAVDPAMQGKTK